MHMAQIDPMFFISRQVGKLMILSQQQQLKYIASKYLEHAKTDTYASIYNSRGWHPKTIMSRKTMINIYLS